MSVPIKYHKNAIHRHTGGLEMLLLLRLLMLKIHRHTGGLEKSLNDLYSSTKIHRHTGGLEIF